MGVVLLCETLRNLTERTPGGSLRWFPLQRGLFGLRYRLHLAMDEVELSFTVDHNRTATVVQNWQKRISAKQRKKKAIAKTTGGFVKLQSRARAVQAGPQAVLRSFFLRFAFSHRLLTRPRLPRPLPIRDSNLPSAIREI